jgi:hypothetical protein
MCKILAKSERPQDFLAIWINDLEYCPSGLGDTHEATAVH